MAKYKYHNKQGVIVPDFSETFQEEQAAFRQLAGWSDVDLSQETPQGSIVAAVALTKDTIARENAALANQINPDYAGGVFLDALVALFGGQRHPATKSTITGVTLTGDEGTFIPAGSRASDGKHEWESLSSTTIPSSGSVQIDFQCTTTGAIACPAHALDKIVTGVLGWKGVDNTAPAVMGYEKEKDFKLKRRRERILGAQGSESIGAIYAALYSIRDVKSVAVWENYTNITEYKDGVALIPHSVYVCVEGGADHEIGAALKSKRGIGAGYNGSEEVTITDEYSNQGYVIKFDRPTPVNLVIKVKANPSVINSQEVIPEIIMQWAAGDIETDAGCEVGRDISPFEIAGAINHIEPSLNITKVEISDDAGSTYSTETKFIAINELAVITNVVVAV